MNIEKFDVYGIKEYSFALNKTNSFFSLPTILLSISIFVLSILINLQTVSHLWLQRKDLRIGYSKSMSLPNPLTNTLICISYDASLSNGTTPKITFRNSKAEEIFFPFVSKEWILTYKSFFIDEVNSNFSCVNMARHKFTQQNKQISMTVYSQKASLFIEVISQNQLLTNEGSILKNISQQFEQSKALGVVLKTIDAVIKDDFKIFSQPQQLTMFYQKYIDIVDLSLIHVVNNQSRFIISHYTPIQGMNSIQPWNRITFSITRLDLGFIIQAVLSWLSILTLAFGFVVSFCIEKFTILHQINSLFYLKPILREPSLIKLIVASVKNGIFPKQDHYIRLSKKLQKLKDISLVLKIKNTLRQLIPFRNKLVRSKEVIICDQYNFVFDQKKEDQIFLQRERSQFSPKDVDFGEGEDEPLNCFNSIKKSLLNSLDLGSDFISIKYQKSHKSKCSFLLTITFIIGFVLFLTMLGAFERDKSVSLSDFKKYNFQLQIKYNQILIATYSPQQIIVNLLDGHNNIIANINLKNSSDCLQGLNKAQYAEVINYGPYIYCFSEGIKLVQSIEKHKVISLFINNTNFQDQIIYIFHFRNNPSNIYYNPLNSMVLIPSYSERGNFYYQSTIKLTSFIEQNSLTWVSWQITFMKIVKDRQLPGLNIILNKIQTTIRENRNTFFDVLQNIWGFGTIFFGILLTKFTKYINMSQKVINTTKERANHREDICILLSKINAIQKGRHKDQLQNLRYYMKIKK